MQIVAKGQRVNLNSSHKKYYIGLAWENSKPLELDVSVMLISDTGKMEEEGDFIFYNNNISRNGEVKIINPFGSYKTVFEIDTSKVPSKILKISFVSTIDSSEGTKTTFRDLKSYSAVIMDANKASLYKLEFEDLTKETALMALDIYRNKSEWKVNHLGFGFNSGLEAVLKEYAGSKIKIDSSPPPPPIDDSTKIINCNKCKGSKEITCSCCDGYGEIKCDSCKGKGEVDCSNCYEGTAYHLTSTEVVICQTYDEFNCGNAPEWRDREHCAALDCVDGMRTVKHHRTERCKECSGRLFHRCSCRNGYIACSKCKGTRKTLCNQC